jgi:DNA-binding LytR/AlgR family response regulator
MSKTFTCIIVDDEPPAIRLLEKYISKVHFLSLENSFTNPLEALQYLNSNTVNLVFLDIQMPEISGIQLSKIINSNTQIIFTTAYAQFALDSYDVAAVDYLLKPIDFERFYKAVNKINTLPQPIQETDTDSYLFVKTDGKNNFVKLFIKDILYIEGLKNYLSIQLRNEQIITYGTLKHLKESLPKQDFVQTHKSYIIALKHIDKIDNQSVWINNSELPIGNTYKKEFYEEISKKKL